MARDRRELIPLVVGVLLIAVNLRPAITALPPIFPELRQTFALSESAGAVLAALPVGCFGIFSFAARPLARRFGEERVLWASLVVLALAQVVRPLGGAVSLFAGTVLAGCSIASLSVLSLSLIKRRAGDRVGVVLGCYMMVYGAGVLVSSGVSVALYEATGNSVLITVGIWALPAIAAVLGWAPQLRHRPPSDASTVEADSVSVYRSGLAWQVAGFMGAQALAYYTAVSFLPEMFRDRGLDPADAGLLNVVLGLGGAVVSFTTPALAAKMRHQRALVVASMTLAAVGFLGCLLAPVGSAVVWVAAMGVGFGATQPIALYLTIARAGTPDTTAALSSMCQGVGYMIALFGPLAAGLLHAATGSWTAPVIGVVLVIIVGLVVGVLAGRARTIVATP